ncbi:hypothetical protein HanIR_Chr10g0452381 [Helianthus annuus]|nr:hypothetical protein HanIR_Chr10g0452381 [Helianthus annuus]
MNYIVLFLTLIICTSSVSCASSINDDQMIAMVVQNDQTPATVQFGRSILKGYNARKCGGLWEKCAWYSTWCCEGLGCNISNECEPVPGCLPEGSTGCNALIKPCCYPYYCSDFVAVGISKCVPF